MMNIGNSNNKSMLFVVNHCTIIKIEFISYPQNLLKHFSMLGTSSFVLILCRPADCELCEL